MIPFSCAILGAVTSVTKPKSNSSRGAAMESTSHPDMFHRWSENAVHDAAQVQRQNQDASPCASSARDWDGPSGPRSNRTRSVNPWSSTLSSSAAPALPLRLAVPLRVLLSLVFRGGDGPRSHQTLARVAEAPPSEVGSAYPPYGPSFCACAPDARMASPPSFPSSGGACRCPP
jgi:hypothetical protein